MATKARVLYLVFLICFVRNLSVEARSDVIQLVQKSNFGSDEYEYEPGGMAASPEGYLVIAGTACPAGRERDGTRKLWVWKMDLEGGKIEEVEIKNAQERPDLSRVKSVKNVATLGNGDVLLLLDFAPQTPVLVRVNKTGHTVFSTEVVQSATAQQNVVLMKVLPLINGDFFLIGLQSSDALVVKIDRGGNSIWAKRFSRERRPNMFLDGFATEDGGAVLVGNSGALPAGGGEPSEIWLVRVDAEGILQAEQTFPGRNARVAQTPSGGCVVTYDLGQRFSQDVWLQALSPDLKPTWKAHLFSSDFGALPVQVASTLDNGYVFATAKRNMWLWTKKVDKEGKPEGEYVEEQDKRLPVDQGLVVVRDWFFLLSRQMYTNAKKQLASKVEVRKFTMK